MKTKLADVALGFVSLLLLVQISWLIFDTIVSDPPSVFLWQQLGLILLLATGCVLLWRTTKAPQKTIAPFKSFVLLLRTPRDLTIAQLRQAVASSLGVLCAENDKTATNYITDTSPAFLVHAQGYTILVNNCDSLYIDHSQNTQENIPNVRLQQVIRDHRAWLSVDLLEAPETASSDLIYQQLGRLTAALADTDCVGIYCPETSQLNVWHSTLVTLLQGANPRQAVAELADVPAVRIPAKTIVGYRKHRTPRLPCGLFLSPRSNNAAQIKLLPSKRHSQMGTKPNTCGYSSKKLATKP